MAQELYELPQGWEWRSVAQVSSKIQYGFTAKASEKGNARFLRITDIQNDHVNWDRVPFVQIETADLAKYQLRKNDIVFARSGATSGKSFLITEDPTSSIFASYLIRIVPNTESISPEFLYKYFQAPEYWAQVLIGATGAAQPNINGKKLGGFILPVPPLAEQERIVAKLDALFSRIDQAIAQLQHTQAQTKALFASALDAAFSKCSTTHTIEDVCDLISGQHLNKSEYTESAAPDSIPYLTGPAEFGKTSPCPTRWTTTLRAVAEPGDTLITVKGSGVGKTNFVKSGQIAISRQLMAIRPRGGLNSDFLTHFLKARQQQFADKKTGAAIPGIGRKDVLEQVIPVPPLAEQSKFVAQLDAISERTQALTVATSAQLEKLQALKASLLDAAFRGQLPSDQ